MKDSGDFTKQDFQHTWSCEEHSKHHAAPTRCAAFWGPGETQRGPERPREVQRGPAQTGPETPREAQTGSDRVREAKRGPERPRKSQRGPGSIHLEVPAV